MGLQLPRQPARQTAINMFRRRLLSHRNTRAVWTQGAWHHQRLPWLQQAQTQRIPTTVPQSYTPKVTRGRIVAMKRTGAMKERFGLCGKNELNGKTKNRNSWRRVPLLMAVLLRKQVQQLSVKLENRHRQAMQNQVMVALDPVLPERAKQ